MWVYQQPSEIEAAAAANKPSMTADTAPSENAAQPRLGIGEAAPRSRGEGRPPQHYRGQAPRGCAALAAAYLLGTALAGALRAMCDARELEALSYFLSRWCALFNISDKRGAAVLFGTEYFAAALVLTLLLLLGLSAVGSVPIFLLLMLYGTGCGLLATQLFAGLTPKLFAAYIIVAGIPIAAAAGCMCVFGAAAVQVCRRLRAFSFSSRQPVLPGPDARALLGQYALALAGLLPVSGAATALVCLANQIHLW